MLLKGQKRIVTPSQFTLPLSLIGVVILLLLIKYGLPFEFSKREISKEIIYCSAENVNGEYFISNGHQFKGVNTKSSENARTGRFSSKLDDQNNYGISYTIEKPIPRATYKAEVWFYNEDNPKAKVYLTVTAPNNEDFYMQTGNRVEQDGKLWKKLECVFTIPKKNTPPSINIFVYKSQSNDVIYVDDLKIQEIEPIKGFEFDKFQAQTLGLEVNQKGLDKLQEAKERSFKTGIMITKEGDEVKAKIQTKNNTLKGKIRYKGDWLDHLRGNSPSYRITLKSTDSWNGMQTFSVQDPKTRGYLNEWVYHQYLKAVDVLTTRYDLMYLTFNGKPKQLYAYEEHFTKNLVENQLRREGPIIKLTEDRYWDGHNRNAQVRQMIANNDDKNRALWTSEIKPFKEKKTQNSETLSKSFEIAQNLVHQYKFNLRPANEVFDLDRLAKYLVIVELLQAEHSLHWHNQRFYYNPVTALLEPIGFDGYAAPGNYSFSHMHAEKVYKHEEISIEPIHRVFYDKEFVRLYIKYLNEFTSVDFLKKIDASIEEDLLEREKFIQLDKKGYQYDRKGKRQRALQIGLNIFPYDNALAIFKKTQDGDSIQLELNNTHVLPLEIVQIGSSKLIEGQSSLDHWVFPQREKDVPAYSSISGSANATHIHYKLPGMDSIFTRPIPKWTSPKDWSPRQELLEKTDNPQKQIYTDNGDAILFEKKVYSITEPLILPKGKRIIIEPGTEFHFSNGGFLLAFSAVEMRGDQDAPIIVKSLDNRSGSFTILQAKEPSFIRHVRFQNQNTLAYKGWNLTGGVTFYESDVEVLHCQFLDNNCEDALNIVRSKFQVTESRFQNIFGDAFDADFCNGKVKNCTFVDVGNDALDFSTSVIRINTCEMKNIGDKAISAGEQANIYASNITVRNANIGFASKDKSFLDLYKVFLYDVDKGFTAYQKKPEYGPATIQLKGERMNNVKFPFMIEKNSVLNK